MTEVKTQRKKTRNDAAKISHQTVFVGTVARTTDSGMCWVDCMALRQGEALAAVLPANLPSVVPGQQILLQLINGDNKQPVVTAVLGGGLIYQNEGAVKQRFHAVEVNGETVCIGAQQRLTLQCGKARLTLHADGSIEIRGTDLLSRSSGQNAIRGASIALN